MITCPNELLFRILGYLCPETIAQVALVNKHFYAIARDNMLWKAKFYTHFPHLFQSWVNKKNVEWYLAFCKTYSSEYKGQSRYLRRLFSLVKEGDLGGLRDQRMISLDDLLLLDQHRKSLVDWARLRDHQPALDYLYECLTMRYTTRSYNYFGVRLIYWAIVCRQNVSVILEILSNDEKLSYNFLARQHLIHLAAQVGHLDLLRALSSDNPVILQQLDHFTRTPLIFAVKAGHLSVVEYILNHLSGHTIHHVDLLRKTALYYAVSEGHSEVLQLLIQWGADLHLIRQPFLQPIHVAAQKGHLRVLTILLETDPTLREQRCAEGKTPLMHAAIHGHIDIVAFLIARGADLNARSQCPVFSDRVGTAIYYAVYGGYSDLVRMLLVAETKIKCAASSDSSLLYFAIKNNHLEVVQLLLEFYPDSLETSLGFGDTPLILAAVYGHLSIVEYLIDQGANTNAVSKNTQHRRAAKTALDCAASSQHLSVIAVLLRRPVRLDSARYDLLQYFLMVSQQQVDAQQSSNNKKYFTLFSRHLPYETVRQAKINAVCALVQVVFGHEHLSILSQHKDVLRKGTLKAVYRNLVKLQIIGDPEFRCHFSTPQLY